MTVLEKQLFLLNLLQEKALISRDSRIIIKVSELAPETEAAVTFLSALQRAGALKIVSVEECPKETSFFTPNILDIFKSTKNFDLKDLEKNTLMPEDSIEVRLLSEFYGYFEEFCKENDLPNSTLDKKLLEVIENKEEKEIKKAVEKMSEGLGENSIKWRCVICRMELPAITLENIWKMLENFKNGQPKSCPKGHHNLFKIQDGKIQFYTQPMSIEELEKYKLLEIAIDRQKKESKIKVEN